MPTTTKGRTAPARYTVELKKKAPVRCGPRGSRGVEYALLGAADGGGLDIQAVDMAVALDRVVNSVLADLLDQLQVGGLVFVHPLT